MNFRHLTATWFKPVFLHLHHRNVVLISEKWLKFSQNIAFDFLVLASKALTLHLTEMYFMRRMKYGVVSLSLWRIVLLRSELDLSGRVVRSGYPLLSIHDAEYNTRCLKWVPLSEPFTWTDTPICIWTRFSARNVCQDFASKEGLFEGQNRSLEHIVHVMLSRLVAPSLV